MSLVVINILKDCINIVHMFQPPLLINGHRFLNLCLMFYVQNLERFFLVIKFFHLDNCFVKNIKATDLKFSTNVHTNLLHATIEGHFKIYIHDILLASAVIPASRSRSGPFLWKLQIRFKILTVICGEWV